MTTIYGLGNEVELDLNNISAAESDEDDRQDEIKELLAGALNNETFYDEDEDSEASFAHTTLFQNNNNKEGGSGSSLFSLRSNPNLAANFSSNGFSSLNGYGDQHQRHPHRLETSGIGEPIDVTGFRADPKVRLSGGVQNLQKDRESEEMEAKNATVSLMHQKHCPQQHGRLGNGDDGVDGEDENQIWLGSTTSASKTDQLKTLCDVRERQIIRCEESISTLTKDKRALHHQVGLMRTEMIQMKGTQDELEKIVKLKDEEIEYMRRKIQEAIAEFENLKRGEAELKNENNRLQSEISRLEQEVKLSSAIGSSVKQAETGEIVRQIRDKHAREIASWKKIVADLEGELRTHKRSEQLFQANSTPARSSVTTQTLPTPTPVAANKATIGTQSENSITARSSNATQTLPQMVRLNLTSKGTQCEKSELVLVGCNAVTQTFHQNASSSKISKGTQSSVGPEIENILLQYAITQSRQSTSNSQIGNTSSNNSVLVQTDETLKTYEVLAGLIEQWAQEVSDSVKRAELAESQARFTEESLKKLRIRFKEVSRMVSLCRKEWKAQEQLLKTKHAETKAHYINILLNLGARLDSLDEG